MISQHKSKKLEYYLWKWLKINKIFITRNECLETNSYRNSNSNIKNQISKHEFLVEI